MIMYLGRNKPLLVDFNFCCFPCRSQKKETVHVGHKVVRVEGES